MDLATLLFGYLDPKGLVLGFRALVQRSWVGVLQGSRSTLVSSEQLILGWSIGFLALSAAMSVAGRGQVGFWVTALAKRLGTGT